MSGPTYPLKLDASESPDASRWLWIVKFILIIPHLIVLVFLWVAYVVLTVIAFFSILFTARYPRAIFDFNVGVLRWSWRVGYYSYSANGTDLYPPFTLKEVPDYPTRLEVDHPEKLSQGLVLVKWWLLAIPHLIIVGIFAGGTWYAVRASHTDLPVSSGGLINLLVLVALVVLLFTGKYPQPLYEFVMGMNRWVLRVVAYVSLMTDEYPPFRLDMGGPEPGATAVPAQSETAAPAGPVPSVPPTPVVATAAPASAWSGGKVAMLIAGCLLAMFSFALLTAGGATLWADRTQRDADGYVTTGQRLYTTSGAALTTSPIDFSAPGSAWIVKTVLGDVRVHASSASSENIFVGIGPTADVDAYLAGVSRGIIEDSRHSTVEEVSGSAASPPGEQKFWVVSASGKGARTVDWPVVDGQWTIVAMNPDGSKAVRSFVSAGATIPALGWISFGLLAVGAVMLGGGVLLIVFAVRRASAPGRTG
jgi:hypothetical protein